MKMKHKRTLKEFASDVIKTVLENHPKDCIFINNTIEYITEQIPENATKTQLTDLIDKGIRHSEIYCPHENINRMPNLN